LGEPSRGWRLTIRHLEDMLKICSNHIKLDLHPYICLVEECTAPVELFATSKEWLSHMRKCHFTQWSCGISTHTIPVHLESEDDFIKHMKAAHPGIFGDETLPLIAQHSSHTRNQIFEACPFCDVVGNELEVHVAEHLRELALLSWPTDLEEDGEVSCDPLENDGDFSDASPRPADDDIGGSDLSFDDSFNRNDENWGVPGSAMLEYDFLGQHCGLIDLNVAESNSVRLEQSGEMKDLEEAIHIARRAVELTPLDHPDRPGYLNTLSSWLKTRYEQTGEMKDLQEAIHIARQAVQSTSPVPVTNKSKSLDRSEIYTVGWIVALPIELTAALAMLDEEHGRPDDFKKPSSDDNSYHWGRIGQHNIVITSLAAGTYGHTSVTTTTVHLLSSLPSIRFCLMVGIGAGIARPNQKRDIRLGDIAVSLPQGQSGGVLQYDLGTSRVSGDQGHATHAFKRVGSLNSPPEALLKALTSLRAQVRLKGSKISSFLEAMLERYPQMVENEPDGPGYIYQREENDTLFEASYIHASDMGCDDCDSTRIVPRAARRNPDVPRVHYGVIASANVLVKDAAQRDLILKESGENCICLEMEAAGLMNLFPCLVIRGICDYADSHKNDNWQAYAAATAAAYAKEFLGYVDSQDLAETSRAIDILQNGQ
jgi:nucleoside phosphorylase